MFDKILGAIKKDQGVAHLASLMGALNQLMAHLSQEYVTDPIARDNAIDGICQYLQSLKTSATEPKPPLAS